MIMNLFEDNLPNMETYSILSYRQLLCNIDKGIIIPSAHKDSFAELIRNNQEHFDLHFTDDDNELCYNALNQGWTKIFTNTIASDEKIRIEGTDKKVIHSTAQWIQSKSPIIHLIIVKRLGVNHDDIDVYLLEDKALNAFLEKGYISGGDKIS